MERGFTCNQSCINQVHNACHMEYCPRLEKAYELLQKFVDMDDEQWGGGEIEEFAQEVRTFLKEDESWTPEEDRKQRLLERETATLKGHSCVAGDTFCCLFRRTGDDYGNCFLNGQSCPVHGFVDVAQTKKKEQEHVQTSNT